MKSSRYGAPAIPSPLHRQPRSPHAPALRALLAALACLICGSQARAAERQVIRGNRPAVLANLAPVGRVPGNQRLNLAIALPLRNQAALTDLLRQLYDPASPRYRQYLTPAQFTAQFGPTAQDYDAVAAFANAHHLTVARRYSNRLVLDVGGAVADIETTFHVTMRTYRHPTEARNFYAPDGDPSLDLGVPISHITGLSNYALPHPCFRKMPLAPAGANPNAGSGPSGTYMGYDFRSAYAPGVALTGSGQIVGLLEFDGYNAGDITYYEGIAGLPKVPLTNVLLDGFNGTPSTGNGQIEVSLDIEMDVSMAPGASGIRIYEAGPSGNFDDVLDQIVLDNLARQISSSWSLTGQGDNTTADNYFKEMAAQGQSFFQASGDSDAYTGAIPFPCDNPYITEVGGTTLTDTGAGGSWNAETVWNWGYDSSAGEYVGSSGGISPTYSIPSWQKGLSMTANKGSTTKRNVPDVALTANNVYVEEGGAAYSVGGTSCAAPLWAAFTALVNQQAVAAGKSTVGFINQAIYTIGASSSYATDFHDITTGNNYSSSSPSKFPAATGYDLCTGWGTPSGAPLINALAPIPASLDVSPTATFSSAGPVGGPFTPSTSGYALSNPGTSSSLAWTASASQSWLSLSATSGTLAAGGTTTVTASINAGADTLASGTYSGAISFTYVTNGTVQSAPVILTVVAPPAITSATNALATQGQPFTYQIAATNGPVTYNASGLPAGLTVNTATGLISGTATATGTSAVAVSAINLGGTGNATLSLLVRTPYAAWQSAIFTPAELANPAISGDTASPAGDGIPNLMKYALDLDPWTNGAGELPVQSVATTGSGNYLTLTYTQVISAIDLTYTVQVSTDLKNWYSGPGYTNPPVAADSSNGVSQTVTVQAAAPINSNAPARFIRLRVTGP